MVSSSATPSTENPNPNPNPKKPKNVHHIGGIQVQFPYRPYGTQLAFMGRVIATLDRAQREGHCHALLESPTGTGKSLSLLCSTLAWQQHCWAKAQCQSKADPKAMTDPLDHGGGFLPEDEPSSIQAQEGPGSAQSMLNNKNKKAKALPKIYYASRTHSQISQVIREYRKTGYRVPMSVLASRKHYCTNAYICGKDNIDEECKLLLRNKDGGCPEYRNVDKVKGHPSLQKGGCHEAFDIEDLVKVGQVVKGCSYYAARSMASSAQLVFCPYNYIINPVIRGAMSVDLKGAIVVFDEAHNIEDIARDAGSVDVEEETLHKLKAELEILCNADAMVYQPLYEMTQDLLSWIAHKKTTLEKHDFQDYVSCWTGDKALRELQEANIYRQSFSILLECAVKAIEQASDTESTVKHLSGMAVTTLEGLFSSLTYFFSRDGHHMSDYQLAIRKYVKKDSGKTFGDWTYNLSLWCLNPAVVFKDIAELSLSVILTSGTLSPMNTFSSELGVQFGTSLEAAHIIDTETQVWSAIMSTGHNNFPLNASYKTASLYAFQDALGKSLEEIFKVVPGGCLVFFPSYKLMEKLSKRWCETGQWSKFNANKSLFAEPRGGSQEDFESVLKGYYDAINGVNKPLSGRRKRIKKLDNNEFTASQHADNTSNKGAVLFAVCRGKVSEGIDFSDDNARMVIIVGIPFPNINDILVSLKKKYNDAYKASKNLLSGSEWYCQQAFRALNQAAGRCIRHRSDYGAIIFLDERYQEERNRAHVSKWLRKSIRQYNNFDLIVEGLKSFFSNVKEQVSNMMNALENFNTGLDNVLSADQSKGSTRKQDQKFNKSDHSGQKELSLTRHNTSYPLLNPQGGIELQASPKLDEDADNWQEVIDLCSPRKDSRFPTALSSGFSLEAPEVCIVKETPWAEGSITIESPRSFSKDETSSVVSKQLLYDQPSSTDCNKSSPEAQRLTEVTPRRNAAANTSRSILEMESFHVSSVNSCSQKRRKFISSSPVCFLGGQHDAGDANASNCCNGEANRRIDFGVETYCVEEKTKTAVDKLLTINNYAMDRRLCVYCALCKTPLGLHENHQYMMCYLTTSSKIYLESLHKKLVKPQPVGTIKGIPILVTDISSVCQRLFDRTPEGNSEQGVWCEKDGCVFNTIFCPFCSTHNNCLGVQVMATNASNIHLLNKILFYVDRLEIKNLEESINKDSEGKDPFPVSASSMDEVATLNSFDRFSYAAQENNSGGWRAAKSKPVSASSMDEVASLKSFERFSYTPQDNNSGGWRTAKSKLKLPKRGLICKTEDQ